jgi:hypothetical protein
MTTRTTRLTKRSKTTETPTLSLSKDLSVIPVGSDGSGLAHVGGQAADVLTEEQEKFFERYSSADMARLYLINENEGKANYQASLELFQDGTSIAESKQEVLLKKVSQRVKYVNPFGLLQSKLHNALMFVARPNITTQPHFSVSLEYLSWVVDHNTNDYAYMKESLTEMQQTLMQIPDDGDKKWFSTQMVQDVYIDGPMLYYKIPPFLCKLYAAPASFYHISMRMNARFKSKYTLSLYELLRENLWKGSTGHIPLAEFRDRMGIATNEYTEFKRLSMRAIQPALAELEELGEICATVQYGRVNRFVTSVNFIIVQNPKNQIDFDGAYLDPGRYKELREEFGLSQKQLKEITESFPVDRIEEIADVLLYRYVITKQKQGVRNWFVLFKSALKDTEDRYILTTSEKAELALFREQRQHAVQLADAQRRERESERRHAEVAKSQINRMDQFWVSLAEEEKQSLWDSFLASPEGKHIRTSRKLKAGSTPDVTHPLAKASFTDFLKRLERI